MAFKLKSYTIIPPNLYVQRDADRQISSIIEEMERPGYVLVSRQMGKTNLLLNAKRRLESPEDIFVYVDLSNPFDNAKSCFENIIDLTIETHSEKFEAVSKTINERRIEFKDLPPHKQHTNELRLLLSCIKGKLVIILDEIDALTKTAYSDQIFAQIRSIYFSRVNFPELGRLTYILSGVVEPTEIIKDPKISPFNIGQKIFLNDFSKPEFIQFIKNAQIDFPDNILDRIFYWTSGNPRMTWDLSSEVEKQSENRALSSGDVDKIVAELYLTAFDKPPIDNIRELVKNDRELRNAIIEISYKKGKEISDKIKNKLYLAGIINYGENDIHIKNEIISQSLSAEWIRSLEVEDKGLVKIALEFFEKEKYHEALSTFEKYLEQSEFESQEESICRYYMGYAAYRNAEFKKALFNLNKTSFKIEDNPMMYYKVVSFKGLANYYEGHIDECLSCLKIVIDSGRKDELYARALINFGSISLKSDLENRKEEAIGIFKSIVNNDEGFNNEKLGQDFIIELKSIAYYNLAQINKSKNDIAEAIVNYKEAIKIAKPNNRPIMVLDLVTTIDLGEEKHNYVKEIAESIIDGKIEPKEFDPESPLNFNFDLMRDIFVMTFLEYHDSHFNKLKPFLKFLGEKSLGGHLYDLSVYLMNKENGWDKAIRILNIVYSNFDNSDYEIDNVLKYNTLKLLSFSNDIRKSIAFNLEYISMFEKERLGEVDYIDMEIFAYTIFSLYEKKSYDEALKYVEIIDSVKATVSESSLINYLVIYNLQLNIYRTRRQDVLALGIANQIMLLAKDSRIKKQKSNLLGDTGLDMIVKNAESVIKKTDSNARTLNKPQTYIRKDKKISNNDIVKVMYDHDKSVVETKYKKVRQDLENGKCVLVD